jgi:Right handed beta helix region
MSVRRFAAVLVLVIATGAAVLAPAATLAVQVLVVTHCANDTQLRADLTTLQSSGGGTISFSCGVSTISVSAPLPAITTDTTVAGGGIVTLNGASGSRIFSVSGGGHLRLRKITLENGYFNGSGGAISNAGTLSLHGVTVKGSHAPESGGGVYTTGPLDITNSTFASNNSNFGGGIEAEGGAVVTISGSTFHNNQSVGVQSDHSDGIGAAIYLTTGAKATVTNSTFKDNTAWNGGAFGVDGGGTSLSLTGSTVHANKASQIWGGGIFTRNSAVTTVENSTISGNSAPLIGGGLLNLSGATLNVSYSTIAGNTQNAGGYGGAGIENRGSTTNLNGVTFTHNVAGGGGAGMENAFGGVANVYNATFDGNTAGSFGGSGAGFYNFEASSYLTNVTFHANADPTSGAAQLANEFGSHAADTHLTLLNVVAANPKGGVNCDFHVAPDSVATSMSSDGSCGFGAGDDHRKVQLGALASNGGQVKTNLPLITSPLIDHGTASGAPSFDARGVARPQGAGVDIGAVEVKATTLQESQPAITYGGWKGKADHHAAGGTYRVSTRAGSTLTFTFTGRKVALLTQTGPADGKARISIDGVTRCTCDLYAPSTHWQQKLPFGGLSGGRHVVSITVTGNHNAHASGAAVVVDGFTVGSSASIFYEQALAVSYDGWRGISNPNASGGGLRTNSAAGATVVLHYIGHSVTWVTAFGPNQGRADVYIDGHLTAHEDLYEATADPHIALTFQSTGNQQHTLLIKVLHSKNPASTGYGVSVDSLRGVIRVVP